MITIFTLQQIANLLLRDNVIGLVLHVLHWTLTIAIYAIAMEINGFVSIIAAVFSISLFLDIFVEKNKMTYLLGGVILC
jgi:hypothetical protein